MHRLRMLLALLAGLGSAIGCSFLNAPDEVKGTPTPGPGGGGGADPSPSGGGAGGIPNGSSSSAGGRPDPVCGNGLLEQGEACDDGNDEDGDACSVDCAITEFDVEADVSLGNERPAVGTSGVDGNRGFFVVWRHHGPRQNEIRGRAYRANGKRAFQTALKLSTAAIQGDVRIGTNAAGRSIVAWASEMFIRYRTIEPDGMPAGPSEGVIVMDANSNISVGASATGSFALTWRKDESNGRIAVLRCFNAEGRLEGSLPMVTLGQTSATSPRVWGLEDGFVASWVSDDGVLTASKLDTQCALQGPKFQLTTEPQSLNPEGAYVGPDDQFLAVFEQPVDVGAGARSRILWKPFPGAANSPEVEQLVSTSDVEEYQGTVARHDNGRFVVAWSEVDGSDCRVKARVFEPDGTPLAPEFMVNQIDEGCQSWPGVAVNADGDAMFVWDNATGVSPYRISALVIPRLLVKAF